MACECSCLMWRVNVHACACLCVPLVSVPLVSVPMDRACSTASRRWTSPLAASFWPGRRERAAVPCPLSLSCDSCMSVSQLRGGAAAARGRLRGLLRDAADGARGRLWRVWAGHMRRGGLRGGARSRGVRGAGRHDWCGRGGGGRAPRQRQTGARAEFAPDSGSVGAGAGDAASSGGDVGGHVGDAGSLALAFAVLARRAGERAAPPPPPPARGVYHPLRFADVACLRVPPVDVEATRRAATQAAALLLRAAASAGVPLPESPAGACVCVWGGAFVCACECVRVSVCV